MKKILFIIGSLRKESFNKKLAEEVEQMLSGMRRWNISTIRMCR